LPPDAEPCRGLVADPRCGEQLRRYLKDHQLMLRSSRPLKKYPVTRQPVPFFPVRDEAATLGIRDSFIEPCKGLIELVQAACRRREEWRPPASYTIVGEVAIISLSKELRGREKSVAENILRHVKGVKAVYGKEVTEGEYRVQRLIHLAGEEVEEVIYREHGLAYKIPLGKVYVNPRLSAEHYRVASQVGRDEYVLDMFAGIGGFSLLISSMGRAKIVVANDANPWAVTTMLEAIRLNKGRLRTPILVLNLDARILPQVLRPVFTRIIMNLPHNATKFLDVAHRLCSPKGCVIHLYIVAGSEEEAISRLPGVISVSRVLDYAPRKFIYRVDIRAKGGGDQ